MLKLHHRSPFARVAARLVGILAAMSLLLAAGCKNAAVLATVPDSGGPEPTALASATQDTRIPRFSHVYLIVLENREYDTVIGNSGMPRLNDLAKENTLLTSYYAVAHPSLPNYIALIGGDTFGIKSDCTDCFLNQPSLPDVLEKNGLTWKAYQEDLPSPCFVGSTQSYAQKHNPFVYFDPIRTDKARCQAHVVGLTQLAADLAANQAPSFAFITPNMCHSGHNCEDSQVDGWLNEMVKGIQASPAYDDHSLIVVTWDEGQKTGGCCGMSSGAGGGRVAAVLISPLAQAGLQDDTAYTHYSLLRTLLAGWGLPPFGQAADSQNVLIEKPWAGR